MRFASLLALPILFLAAGPAGATTLADPVGDFLPTYTGPRGADLDVTSISVTFDGSAFTLAGTMAGPVGTTAGALYVWGVDRGAGTERFQSGPGSPPAVGKGVTFDSVLALNPAGGSAFRDLISNTSIPLPAADLQISGNTITAELPLSFAPSLGRAPTAYGFNLWPRVGAGQNVQISDFAPDASDVTVPEPGSLALLLGATVGLGLGRKRQKEAAG